MSTAVSTGQAEQLSRDPPVFLLHGLLTADEVAAARAIGARRRERWRQLHPLVCFQHDSFTGHAGLAGHWGRLLGRPGRGARGCLTQEASRAVAPSLPASESLFVYRGQEQAFEALAARVEQRAGLHSHHAHPWQMLSYREGEHYADHTDCEEEVKLSPELQEPKPRHAAH